MPRLSAKPCRSPARRAASASALGRPGGGGGTVPQRVRETRRARRSGAARGRRCVLPRLRGCASPSAGCTALSDSGPSRRDVEARATATIGPTEDRSLLDYALVDLNRGVLPLIDDPGPGSLLRTFGDGHGPAPELEVGVGDTVQVTLFEAQSGGLFIPADAGAAPATSSPCPIRPSTAAAISRCPTPGRSPFSTAARRPSSAKSSTS